MATSVRALRGATTVDEDSRAQVIERVVELLRAMQARNGFQHDDVISVWFTATDDIHSMFPAEAARSIGYGDVPLICARELDIEGAMPLCIRVLMHLETERTRNQLDHVYLHGAASLRDDLPGGGAAQVVEEPGAVRPIAGRLDAEVTLPGSKSLTNRALLVAALAQGRSRLTGVLHADDTEAMASCLRDLAIGVSTDWENGVVEVSGVGGKLPPGPARVDARQSGTTARFLAPVLALGEGDFHLSSHPQMAERPMTPLFTALRELGVEVVEDGVAGHLPVTIRGDGRLGGGRIRLPGHLSSQFLSGMLMAAPAMRSGLVIEVTGELVSKPYVDMTADVMNRFGVAVGRQSRGQEYVVSPGTYRATEFAIEADATAASYFFAAAAVCGGRVRVQGLGRGTSQGDLRFVDVLARMGCDIDVGRGYTEVVGTGELRGVTADLADFSDTAPTLAVVAAFASSPTRVTGVGFIRRKESDRIAAIVNELTRTGVDAAPEPDGFVVRPVAVGAPHGARIECYDDHRIAMAFAVMGLRVPGIVITDPGCVGKTFPTYFEVLDGLR